MEASASLDFAPGRSIIVRAPRPPPHKPPIATPTAITGTTAGKIARSFLALASGDALARVIAFVAYVFVARLLGASMFGVIGFGQAVVLYFAHLSACGVDLPGMRDVAKSQDSIRTLAPGIMTVRLLVSIGLMLVLAGGALLFLEMPESGVVALFSLTLLAHGPNTRFIHLGLQDPRPVAWSRTLGEALFLALVLTLVREPRDLGLVVWCQFLGDLSGSTLMVWMLKRRGVDLPLRLDWQRVAPVFKRSFPLVVNILLGLMIFNADLIFLWAFRTTETVGYYNASYQLISFLINLAWAYSFSLLPALTRADPATAERRALYATSVAQTFAVALPLAVGGAMLAPQIIALVFGAEYEPAGAPLAILVASVPFMIYKDVGMVTLIVHGREKTVMKMTAVAVVANILLNLLVIPRYGMVGAACTTLATEVLRAGLTSIAISGDGYRPVGVSRLWKSSVAAIAMGLALWFAAPTSVVSGIPIGVAAFSGALVLTGGLRWQAGQFPRLDC